MAGQIGDPSHPWLFNALNESDFMLKVETDYTKDLAVTPFVSD